MAEVSKGKNPKSLPTQGRPSLRRRPRMGFKQLQVQHRQPQEEQQCPDAPPEAQRTAKAAASGKQVAPAGSQGHVLALHTPCCPPGPLPSPGAAQPPGGQWAKPEPGEGARDNKEEKREVCSPYELYLGENHIEQKLSQGEVTRTPELCQGGKDGDKESWHENSEHFTIRTIWVNPRYPELLRGLSRVSQEAKAAAPHALDEQVAAAGTQGQGPVPDSPSCSPCSSRSQLAAQTLSDLQALHGQRSSPRRALQALCSLFWCFCVQARSED